MFLEGILISQARLIQGLRDVLWKLLPEQASGGTVPSESADNIIPGRATNTGLVWKLKLKEERNANNSCSTETDKATAGRWG